MTGFSLFDLLPPILAAVQEAGYVTPTPIQEQAIPHLRQGRDLLGIAQTGTGKTAAFALPILDRLARRRVRAGSGHARALILTPTRELATQIDTSFATYGRRLNLSRAVIFGGVGQRPQVQTMGRGVDILTATPGRLLDLMNQGFIKLDRLEIFVLDEADRMLDMGFIHDIRMVISHLPVERQTLFFSATMPKDIALLAKGILTDPVRVEATPPSTTVERVVQKVMFVEKTDKRHLLRSLLQQEEMTRALVFTRTKHGADKVVIDLEKNHIVADAIHGNKSQSARERALSRFRTGEVRVLVATDIAARGIDVSGVSHVINYDLPNEPENYVHRIGRTARAGKEGVAISMCDGTETGFLRAIESTIRAQIPVDAEHPYHSEVAVRAQPQKQPPRPAQARNNNNSTAERKFSRPKPTATHNRSAGKPDSGNRPGTTAGTAKPASKSGGSPGANAPRTGVRRKPTKQTPAFQM
ncbi:MAG: DEAD/DEAH box helicase [Magnetococcales bacterium]|nr:DEAD/DEAH box helicase [Magnetococcales bacterium]